MSVVDWAEALIFRSYQSENEEAKNLGLFLKELIYFSKPKRKALITMVEQLATLLGLISYLPNLDKVPLNRQIGFPVKSGGLFPPIASEHVFEADPHGMPSPAALPGPSYQV